jgi:branched-subunit alpha-ketoacid dehydrogenase kinase
MMLLHLPYGDLLLLLMSMYAIDGPVVYVSLHYRWVQKDATPISLRQLTFFGRRLTEQRLLSSANYVRTELPTRYVLYVFLWAKLK